ncbi:MAG: hypothetical protein DRQ51_01545 [Gammaproteobacteria bacterium]|nr:MAG: hypothetical protein DRQ51_01545 [Gammaproteobacteria bacterium]
MKKIIILLFVFMVSLLYFSITAIPLTQIMSMVNIPKNIIPEQPSGTIFNGSFSAVTFNKHRIENVKTSLNIGDLLLLNTSFNITGDYINGKIKLKIGIKDKQTQITNLTYENSLQNLLSNWNLDLITTAGKAHFSIKKIILEKNRLKYIAGNIDILRLNIESPSKLQLGDVHINITTSQQDEKIKIDNTSDSNQIQISGMTVFNILKKTYKTAIKINPKQKLDNQLISILRLFAKQESDNKFIFKKKGKVNF